MLYIFLSPTFAKLAWRISNKYLTRAILCSADKTNKCSTSYLIVSITEITKFFATMNQEFYWMEMFQFTPVPW